MTRLDRLPGCIAAHRNELALTHSKAVFSLANLFGMRRGCDLLRHSVTPLPALVLISLCLFAPLAWAQDFGAPKGEVILTLSGQISHSFGDRVLALDAAQLATLPQHSFITSTTWTDGTPTFQGVLLKDMIAATGATGATIVLTALNDYKITIPASDVQDDAPCWPI